MKRDEILNMPAGRMLDVLIAERIFGYTNIKSGYSFVVGKNPHGKPEKIKSYSADISAAWQVVEKFSENPALANDIDIITTIRGWKCTIRTNKLDINANAEAAPLAICRAALLAVMELE